VDGEDSSPSEVGGVSLRLLGAGTLAIIDLQELFRRILTLGLQYKFSLANAAKAAASPLKSPPPREKV